MVLSCFNFLTAEGRARNRMIARERELCQEQRPWWSVSFKRSTSSKKFTPDSNKYVSVKGVSMKFALETEQSFKQNVDVDLLNETPWTDRMSAAIRKYVQQRKQKFYYDVDKFLSTLPFVIYLKVKIRMLLNYLFAEKIEVSVYSLEYDCSLFVLCHAGWR